MLVCLLSNALVIPQFVSLGVRMYVSFLRVLLVVYS